MEVLDSTFHDSTYDPSYIADIDNIDLQPPSPQSQSHIDLFNNTNNNNNEYQTSPFSSHSDLSEQLSYSSGALFAADDSYDPTEYDHPGASSRLFMFDDNPDFDLMHYSDSSHYSYRSPSPGSENEHVNGSRSRASSTSSNNTHFQRQSPDMPVQHSFGALSFSSPRWNTESLPQVQQQHKPPSPPRLLMPDPPIVINAPDGDGDGDSNAGPRLQIVPATPVSGGGAATSEVPFQASLETLRQGSTLEAHHLQPTWLDVDKSNTSSRAPSPAHSLSATTPGPSRSPSASPQPPHHPSPHLSHPPLPTPFLFPGQGQPRSRSKSDTSLEPPNWSTVTGYLNTDQQIQQQQEMNDQNDYASHQTSMQGTAHPPTLGHNFSFGPPASSASSSQPPATGNGYLSPDIGGSFHAQPIRRSKSDAGGRHRTSRSEDIRPPVYDTNYTDSTGFLFPPTSQDGYMRQGRTPQFLSPSMGPGLTDAGHGHGHTQSMGSHPGFNIPSAASGRGGTHYRRASSGTRSERGTSVGAWEAEGPRVGGSNRVSPYPSPNASPRGRYDELRGGDEFEYDGIAGRQTMQGQRGQPVMAPVVVSKPNVTTGRTANASHKRRKQEATFICPVPGCGSTFTRSFNLKGHIRSHNEEKPYQCKWPGCGKGFARQHDCKRHEQLHTNYRPFTCDGCMKQFARMDALNRHLRSEGGAECLKHQEASGGMIPGDNPSSSAPTSAASSAPSPALSSASARSYGTTNDGVTVTYSNGEGYGGPTKMEDSQWGLGVAGVAL